MCATIDLLSFNKKFNQDMNHKHMDIDEKQVNQLTHGQSENNLQENKMLLWRWIKWSLKTLPDDFLSKFFFCFLTIDSVISLGCTNKSFWFAVNDGKRYVINMHLKQPRPGGVSVY